VQTMIEGPGHVPMQLIKENMDLQLDWCDEAPFYTLGRSPPTSPRYDHITSPSARRKSAGTARPCCATSRPRSTWPAGQGRCESGIMAYKIAATRRLGEGPPRRADSRQRAVQSPLRIPLEDQFNLGLDPDKAREFHDETLPKDSAKVAHFCSMCGPHFAP